MRIMIGLICLKKLNICHRDIKFDNIFFKYIDINSIFYYKINGIIYRVPTYGYLVIIADLDNAYFDNCDDLVKLRNKISFNRFTKPYVLKY